MPDTEQGKEEKDWEPSKQELAEAEAELKESVSDYKTDPTDAFMVLLEKWDGWETVRIQGLEDYNLRHELKVDRNEVVKRYTEAKGKLVAIEKRMLGHLQNMSQQERDDALGKGHMISTPGYMKMVVCKKDLADRLRGALARVTKPETAVVEEKK